MPGCPRLHYEVGYRVLLRSAASFQKFSCVFGSGARSGTPEGGNWVFDAGVGVPDGLASGPAVTVRTADSVGMIPDAQAFGGHTGKRSAQVGLVVRARTGQHSESFTIEFAVAPGAGEVTVMIVNPDLMFLGWW